jgi:hypothetical protein
MKATPVLIGRIIRCSPDGTVSPSGIGNGLAIGGAPGNIRFHGFFLSFDELQFLRNEWPMLRTSWTLVSKRRAQRHSGRRWRICAAPNRIRQFEVLKGCLSGESAGDYYRDFASELGISESTVKSAVHRMRLRFGEALRAEIAQTVDDSAEVDDELRYLLTIGPSDGSQDRLSPAQVM